MKRFSGLVACVAMVVATSLSSFAGYAGTGGGIGGGFTSTFGAGDNLSDAFAATGTGFNADGGSGDFADAGFSSIAGFFGVANFGSAPIAIGTAFSVSSALYGSFSGVATSDNGDGTVDQLQRSIIFKGTFTPGSSGLYLGNVTPIVDTLFQVTVAKTSAIGFASRSWSLDTTAASSAVPEPASLAIFGLGAAGFAARRFRRK